MVLITPKNRHVIIIFSLKNTKNKKFLQLTIICSYNRISLVGPSKTISKKIDNAEAGMDIQRRHLLLTKGFLSFLTKDAH